MFNEQETVHADPDHEEDGGVKIGVQDVAVYDANVRIGDSGVICIKVRELWQSAEEKQVRERQVKDVNITALPLLQAEYVAQYNQQVEGETNAELYCIKWSQVVLLHRFNYHCAVEWLLPGRVRP